MKILLDENLPRRLKDHLTGCGEVSTVPECGWSGKQNGELLRLASQAFEVFVTMDQGLSFQQNLSGYDIAVVVLAAESNRLESLLPLVPQIEKASAFASTGEVVRVTASRGDS
ncbi:MAG: DUF5615 family PIN-like protein [Planctomycetota bacterium]